MTFIPNKTLNNKFALRNLNYTQYETYALQHFRAKKGGICCVYGSATRAGVLNVVNNIKKGIVINYEKRKFVAVSVNAGAQIFSQTVVVFTNASKIVSAVKLLYSSLALYFECVENSSNLISLPIYLFLQLIPISTANRFNLFKNSIDFLDL